MTEPRPTLRRLFCAASLALCMAAGPATRPAGAPDTPAPSSAQSSPERPLDAERFVVPTPEERQEARAFLAAHCPNRAKYLDNLLQGPGFGGGPGNRQAWAVGRQIIIRWRELKALETEDPPLYQIKLKRLRAEDHIFGLVRDARQGSTRPVDHGSERNAAEVAAVSAARRAELRDAAREVVALRTAERKHLIAKLQKAIDADTANPDAAATEILRQQGAGDALTAPPEHR